MFSLKQTRNKNKKENFIGWKLFDRPDEEFKNVFIILSKKGDIYQIKKLK